MANVAVLYCKRIQDHSCVACAKCHKAMSERNGEFGRYGDDELELVGITDCGDCPTDFEDLKFILEKKFGCEVVLGTHSY